MFHSNRPSDRSKPQLSTTRMAECACSASYRGCPPTFDLRHVAREFGNFCVPVCGVNFGHRALGMGGDIDGSCGVPLSTRFRSRGGLSFSHGVRDLNPPDEYLFFFFRLHFASFTEPDQVRRFISARLIKFGTSSGPRYLLLVKTYKFDR